FNANAATLATSGAGPTRLTVPTDTPLSVGGVSMSSIHLDEDLLPTSLFSMPLSEVGRPAGWLVAELSLEEIWRRVEKLRIGSRGYALLVASDGRLIAHGNPGQRGLVARGDRLANHPLLDGGSAAPWKEYRDARGATQLGVAAAVPGLQWTLLVEQPTEEAFATATRLGWQLVFAAIAALVLMVGIGVVLGRRFIAPISALEEATRQLAAGDFHARAPVSGAGEFARLAGSFNTMADRLVHLQDAVKRQERQVVFGRVVAGLFHDLNHPIQNIGNNARLMLRDDVDAGTRAALQATIDRELDTLRRFMDDVLSVARPRPLDRFPLEVNGSVTDVADAMRAESDAARVLMVVRCASGPLVIDADRFALSRVYRNLLTNALQATPPGGRVTVSTTRIGDFIDISVADTGAGIPPERLSAIFDDFATTKHRGLGLGLATSRRIVEQLGGSIAVVSTVGAGATFTLRFPASRAQAVEAAS
ncbi:MAG: sensor histidine kinase, partial [Vicinamibacterales bacterium]